MIMKKNTLILLTILFSLLGGGNAWAQNESYDFKALAESGATTITFGTNYSGITNAHYVANIGGTDMKNRFAFRNDSEGKIWFMRNDANRDKGLWCRTNYPDFAICNLYEGDRIRITFKVTMEFASAGSAWVNSSEVTAGQSITSGQEFIVAQNGDLIVRGTDNYTVIEKIEIFYASNRTYNFAGIVSTASTPGGYQTTLDSETIYPLNFLIKLNGEPYDGTFSHPDNFRFAIKEEGWKVDNYGLFNNSNALFYGFCILNLKKGQRITVYYDNTNQEAYPFRVWTNNTNLPAETNVTSGNSFTMTSDGAVQIAVARNVHIQSITITSSPLRFSKLADTYDLTNLGYTEPTLTGASGATVTYTGNNPKVAIPNSSTGDLMIVNTGDVTITATATVNGVDYNASYTLTVMAAESVWDVQNGNECYFPATNVNNPAINDNTGKLLMRRVTSVPHITMEFGDASNENLTMVTFRHDKRAANLIDPLACKKIIDDLPKVMKEYNIDRLEDIIGRCE